MTQVIIATKTSAWELHGPWFEEQHRRSALPDWDFKRIRLAHDEHHETVAKVTDAFNKAKIPYRLVNIDQHDWAIDADTEFVVTLGGDGTLLSASHRVGSENLIIYGLRSSGLSVGFLCAGGPEKIESLIKSIQERSFKVLSASRLRAEVLRAGLDNPILTPPALNDFLYSNANPAATTRYRLSLGDRTEEHKSSGLWCATALGSTAGTSAAGGVIQPRTDRNFQYVVRELYRAPGKNFYLVKGFFDPDKTNMAIENRCEVAVLAADGNHSVTPLLWGDRIVLRRAAPINIAQ